jgi:putative endonuclease
MLWSKGVYKEKTGTFDCRGVRLPIYVYILKSLKDGKFYTGCTADLKKRLKQHNAGRARSTKARRPLKLVYWETLATRSEAMKRERRIKKIGRAGKKALVKDFGGACDDIY